MENQSEFALLLDGSNCCVSIMHILELTLSSGKPVSHVLMTLK